MTVLRNVYADKERGEALLLASPLDYVNVRPARLVALTSEQDLAELFCDWRLL